jgi:hypothetical protein
MTDDAPRPLISSSAATWIAVCAVFSAGLRLLGVLDWPHVIAIALLAAAVVTTVSALARPLYDDEWPSPPRDERPGGRHGLSELSWMAFTRNGRITERVLRRIRAIGAARGVDWTHPPAGLEHLAVARTATPRELDRWLAQLDQIANQPAAHQFTSYDHTARDYTAHDHTDRDRTDHNVTSGKENP